MHLFIEFSPFVFGVFLAQLFYFTKSFTYKNFLFIVLNVLSGLLVNWWSREGIAFSIVDVMSTAITFLGSIWLSKSFTRGLNHLLNKKM